MPPDWDLTKALIRYRGVADALLASGGGTGINGHVVALSDRILNQLAAAKRDDLVEDFNRVVATPGRDFRLAKVSCSAISGWLQGTIEAESLETRIQAEATAYAEARLRAERPVGFAPQVDE